jgi:hypothetical protein
VVELGYGYNAAAADNATEVLVASHLIVDPNRLAVHPTTAVGGKRVGCESGPQRHPGGRRIAGGDAQGERVG